jgi:hypothetical protein
MVSLVAITFLRSESGSVACGGGGGKGARSRLLRLVSLRAWSRIRRGNKKTSVGRAVRSLARGVSGGHYFPLLTICPGWEEE